MKIKEIRLAKSFFLMLLFLAGISMAALGQNEKNEYSQMERIQDENDFYYMKVYDVIGDYPEFNYKYVYENGDLQKVLISGVSDMNDKKRLEVWLYDLRKNKDLIQNIPTRTGIYYSVDEEAQPKNDLKGIYDKIQNNLMYPDKAEDKGVEGTVYVQFVVDSNGDVVYAQATEDIETPYSASVEAFKKEAIKAVKKTSGEWEPAEVNNVDVASWVVLPVNFDFQKDPSIPALIR